MRCGSLVCLLAVAGAFATASPAANAARCNKPLTFRWTSGEPIPANELHPPAASLKNHSFLRNPKILSVSTREDTDTGGPMLRVEFGPSAAAVLDAETSAHTYQQMLIMSGRTVVSAAIVRAPIKDGVVIIEAPFAGAPLERLDNALKHVGPCS